MKFRFGRSLIIIFLAVAFLGLAAWHSNVHASGDTVDEIHYSFGNTNDSVVFDWHGTETNIYYGSDSSYGQLATAAPSAITPANADGLPYEEVQLSGLQPGSVYHYKIGVNGLDHTFQTTPTGDFNWVDIGDSMGSYCDGTDPPQDGSWMPAEQQLIASQNPSFVTHGGDIAAPNQCGLATLHQYYNDQQVWSTGAAFQPVWGNHEYGAPLAGAPADAITDTLSNYKGRSFVTNGQTSPSDTPTRTTYPGCGAESGSSVNLCQGEDWGWFQTGHVLFISYPEPYVGARADWQAKADTLMAQAQANPNIDFIVTYGHREPYTSSTQVIDYEIRDATNALAAKYSPTAANPTGKYILNVSHHAHSLEAFNPIGGLTNIVDAGGGQGLTDWGTIDPNSIYRLMHFGILSAQYSAANHTMTVNLKCGPSYNDDRKGVCTYGSTIYTQTFTAANVTPPIPQPQLQLTYSNGQTQAQSNQTVTYTATLANPSPVTSTGTSISAAIPAGAGFVSATDGVTPVNGVVTWPTGDIPATQTITKQFTVTLGQLPYSSTVTSTASVTATDTSCGTAGSTCTATDTDQTPPLPVGGTTEFVTNQSFETNNTGWTGVYSTTTLLSRNTSIGYDGTASLQITKTGTGVGTAGVNDKPHWVTSTVAGKVYTASVWVSAQTAGQVISVTLRETTPAGTGVSYKTASYTTTDTAWHQLTVSYTAVSSGNVLTYSVYSTNLAQNAWFLMDKASLTMPNLAPPPPVPQLNLTYGDGVTQVQTGQQVTYTATLTNPSATTSAGTNLSAVLPAGSQFVSASDGVTPLGNTVTWATGDLAPGQTITKQIVVSFGQLPFNTTVSSQATATTADVSCSTSGSVCSVTDTDQTPTAGPVQYVTNQSLETDSTGWTGVYSATTALSRNTTTAYDGTASLQVTKTGTGTGTAGVNDKPHWVVNTTVGKVYTASAWVRAQTVGQVITVQLRETTSAGTGVSFKAVTLTATDTNWHQLTVAYTAVNSGDTLTYSVYSTNLAQNAWFLVDMLSLTTPN